nr:unnamed protein product [Digitaria exilis]
MTSRRRKPENRLALSSSPSSCCFNQCTQQQQQCAAYPYNPVTWRCAAARLAHTRLVANTTDGANPLRQVSVRAVAACAPRKLLARLPRDAAGVAGLAASGLALPAQVAASQRVAGKFLLCLPRNAGGEGIAIFGGGPLFLMTSTAPPVEVASDFTSSLTYTPLVSRRGSSSYYLAVTAIAVDKAPVGLPKDALAGGGGVVLGTTAAYTELRPDVYWPVVGAFDRALRRSWNNTKRVAAVAPFELCYDSKTLPGPTRIGWLVPEIVLMLEGGRKTNWTFGGLNTMVDVNGFTAACFGFLKMKPEKDGGYGGKPAVVLGGFQMEDHVLQFDLEKRRLGHALVLAPWRTLEGTSSALGVTLDKTTTTKCKAYPYNPITGKCAAANLVHTRLVANTTDGKTPLQQVSVRAVAACAPPSILASMPKDVTGVAGLSAAGLALPAQVAASQGVARKFLLCLPRRGEGVAIFGGGPLFLLPESSMGDLTTALAFTRLVTRKDNPLYYIPVEAIAVNNAPVTLPANVLAGGGGVVLCSRVSYTMLRPDVYRPVVDAFERALARSDAKVSAAAPFELCYKSSMLGNTRLGYAVPDVALVLEGGKSWTFTGSSSMVDVDGQTACFAFVEMKGVKSGDPSAAGAVVGGFQMEDHLLQFDIEKMQLGFAKNHIGHEAVKNASYHPPGCPRTGYGVADEEDRFRCKCTAHPYNPFAGDKSATGDLTRVTLSANATDGHNPLRPVSFTAVAACAPPSLLANLPAGAAGVAGLAASRVALPAQVAREEKVPDKFLLCLPRSSGDGVAIFGGGPLFLMTVTAPPVEVETDFASSLTYTPLLSRRGSSSYYLPVNAIAVDKEQVKLPAADTLAAGGVVLSTRAPYTALRPDVYRPFVDAFDKALKSQSNSKRVAAVAPFELCYDSKTLPGPTRIGWLVPDIVLVLDGGKTNWTFGGLNTMVDVNGFTAACFGFVEMKVKPEKKGGYGGAPAVEIGGFQMEDHVLQFDLEKRQLGFASYHPPDCPRTGHGVADEDDPFRCKCTAHPYNPVARRSASGDLTRVTVTANDTVGHNPLHPVSFPAVAACAPPSLLANLPAGAAGVAGLARSRVSLPVQAARAQKVANKFALCLPSGGNGVGVAIFGGGPLFLLPPGSPDVTARLAGTTPLVRKAANPGYYVSAKGGVAVNQEGVQRGPLVVGLSSRVPYTELRSDVYGAVVKAFDKATAGRKRVTPAVAPFELCYDSRELGSTRLGYAVPQVDLMMDGGANWTVFGGNSLVQMDDNTACFGFVKMPPEEEEKAAAAVVIGGFQMENNLLVFDEEKQQLGFSGLLFGPPRIRIFRRFEINGSHPAPGFSYLLHAYFLIRLTLTRLHHFCRRPPPPVSAQLPRRSLPSSVIPHHHRLPIGSTRAPAAAAIANQLKIDAHVTSTGSTRGPPLPAVPPPLCCHLDNLHHRPASYPKLPLCHCYDDAGGATKCAAHPYNPVAGGSCASGDLTRVTLSANATDGKNPLYPVTFPAVASCARESLLANLPGGAAGVAGLARSELSLPAQVAATQSVARKLALCLPSGGNGVAVFGGGPLYLLPPWLIEITSSMGSTPLRRYQDQPGYYIWINGININQIPVPLLGHNSNYNVNGGEIVVGFSTTVA